MGRFVVRTIQRVVCKPNISISQIRLDYSPNFEYIEILRVSVNGKRAVSKTAPGGSSPSIRADMIAGWRSWLARRAHNP